MPIFYFCKYNVQNQTWVCKVIWSTKQVLCVCVCVSWHHLSSFGSCSDLRRVSLLPIPSSRYIASISVRIPVVETLQQS
jgi:hypothetical protein